MIQASPLRASWLPSLALGLASCACQRCHPFAVKHARSPQTDHLGGCSPSLSFHANPCLLPSSLPPGGATAYPPAVQRYAMNSNHRNEVIVHILVSVHVDANANVPACIGGPSLLNRPNCQIIAPTCRIITLTRLLHIFMRQRQLTVLPVTAIHYPTMFFGCQRIRFARFSIIVYPDCRLCRVTVPRLAEFHNVYRWRCISRIFPVVRRNASVFVMMLVSISPACLS